MNWKAWLYSLVYSVIGGAANSAAAMFVAPETFNFNDLPRLAKLLGAGAIVSLILYLKQSPLPKQEGGETGVWKSTLGLMLAGCLLATGCETWRGLSPGTQAALKSVARSALALGVSELSGRVKELRPYQDRLNNLLTVTFAQPAPAADLGAALRAGVATVVPEELQPLVLAEFKRRLAGAPAAGGKPTEQDKFNAELADNL